MSEWGAKSERVRSHLLELIGSLDVGERLPPERQLAADLAVSRMTLRHEVENLVREGRLDRRHGSGTYVAEFQISQPLTHTSFTEDMRRRGLTPSSRTLEMETVTAGAHLARCLEIAPSDEVVRISRLRLADRSPMAIETLHVPARLGFDMTAEDLERDSFYALLTTRFNVRLGVGEQTIEPTVTSEAESEHLGVPLRSPALLIERVTRDVSGTVFEFVRSIYRGDRYKLVARLTPPRTRGRG